MSNLSPKRAGRITASRATAILGLSPYNTRADVLRAMVRQHHGAPSEFVGNVATEHGHKMEPVALAEYEKQAGVMTYGGQEFVIHPEYDFLGCTPDGFNGDGLVEVKCPYRATYTSYDDRPDYVAQMQLQMAVTDRPWCDFVVLHQDGSLHVSRLMRDDGWLDKHLPEFREFMSEYEAAIADPDIHLQERERDDSDWTAAAEQWRAAKAAADAAKTEMDLARKRLIELSGGISSHGHGVQVVAVESKGRVQYSRALKHFAPDADLSEFTGKPSTTFRVQEHKQ